MYGRQTRPSIRRDPFVWLFRLGFASIFFVNAVVAFVAPDSFLELVRDTPIATLLGSADMAVIIAGLNDFMLGVLIIVNKWPRYVHAWAGAWLLIVTLVKVAHLL